MEWFRWYHGAISDPKWPLIARKSGQNIGVVVSIWASLLEHASQEQIRGSVNGFNPEAIDALYGYEDETTVTVCNAMRNAGIINDENLISSWEKRQPKRERDDDSSERVKRFREKQKSNNSGPVHNGNGNETDSNATVTPCNAQNRTEQNRTDSKENPLTPLQGGGESAPKKERKKRAPKSELPISYGPDFEEAWGAYPRKNGKGRAWEAWVKATKKGMPVDEMIGIIQLRSAMYDWTKEGRRYVPHMATWLNENGWEDELTMSAPPSPYEHQFAGVI